VRMADPDLLPPDRYPALDAMSAQCEASPDFSATYPAEYTVPQNA
jgi:glutathione S-transferase